MINTSLFPYSTMPFRLQHEDKQKGTVVCFFQCEEHMDKYLERYDINRKKCVILNANDQPTQPSQTDEKPVRPRVRKDDTGSTNPVRGRPKKLDSTGTVGKTTQSKAKVGRPNVKSKPKVGRPKKSK